MVELGFSELTTEQIELLCQTAEDAAHKHILSQVSSKNIERLDISVEVEGTKPVNVTIEIDLLLSKETKNVDAEALVKQAMDAAHKATENFLRQSKMSFKEIIHVLEEQQASFVLLLCHRSADADAICSAYGLQGLLKRFLPNMVVEIGCPAGINKPSKTLLEQMPISVNLKPNIESAEVIMLVDMNTVEQLDEVADIIQEVTCPQNHHRPPCTKS